MNNLYQQLNQQQPQQNNLKLSTQTQQKTNLLKQFLNSSNPQQFIQNMVMNNPKMQNVMQLFQNSNMSPKQFFYQYAQQNGINPEQFLNSLNE